VKRFSLAWLTLAWLALFACPAVVSGQEESTLRVEVHAGYGPGVFARGRTCPVRVDLRLPAGSPEWRGTLSLEVLPLQRAELRPSVHDWIAVELGAGSAKRFLLTFRGDRARGVRVVLRTDAGDLAYSEEFSYQQGPCDLSAGLPLFGTLAVEGQPPPPVSWPGEVADHLLNATGLRHRLDNLKRAAAVRVDPRVLDEPGGLAGIDALLVLEPPGLDAARIAELGAWVEEGGLLLVSAGKRGVQWSLDSIAELLPFEVTGLKLTPQALDGLENLPPKLSARPASLLLGTPRRGAQVLVANRAGAPLVVSWPRGKGRVSVLTFSLRLGHLDDSVRAAIVHAALPLPRLELQDADLFDALEASEQAALREAIEKRTSSAWVWWLILALVFVVGPVDYLVWRRWPNPKVTWGSLLVITLGFSVAAFYLGKRGSGRELQSQSVWIVDGLPGQDPDALRPVEGLFAVAAQGFRREVFLLPETLRFEPTGSPFWSGRSAAQQGHWGMHRNSALAALGLGSPLTLRVRGRARVSFPFSARWRPDGRLSLSSHTKYDLSVVILRREGWIRESLRPGVTRSTHDFASGCASLDGLVGGGSPLFGSKSGRQVSVQGVVGASFHDLALEDEHISGDVGGALRRGVDLSHLLRWGEGATLLVATVPGPPGLVRAGADLTPLRGVGKTVYRLLLPAPPPPEDER
jgi:hypothetical protein